MLNLNCMWNLLGVHELESGAVKVYGKLGILWYVMQLMFIRENYGHLVYLG